MNKPYGLIAAGGFPLTQENGSQVGAIDNTISIGSRLNWEQRLGYVRMFSNSYDNQTVLPDATLGPTFGIGGTLCHPRLYARESCRVCKCWNLRTTRTQFAIALRRPYSTESTTINTGYFQNRLNPSTNVIFSIGKHTLVAGGGYSYTQLNIENNRNGMVNVETKNFETFLEGQSKASNEIDSVSKAERTMPTVTTAPTRSRPMSRTSGRCSRT